MLPCRLSAFRMTTVPELQIFSSMANHSQARFPINHSLTRPRYGKTMVIKGIGGRLDECCHW